MTEPTDIDALIAEARAWADSREGWNQYQVTLGVRLADALESTRAKAIQYRDELRQDRERAQNGSCWDDGPQMRTPGGCDPMPPKCELRAGHLGAHRSGRAEWMRNPASFNQVLKERDEAQSELARAREVIEKTEDWVTAHYQDAHMGEKVLEILAARDQKGRP